MDQAGAVTPTRTRTRKSTAERRDEIVRAAAKTFGTKGYQKGSLIDIAEQVGMTHAGVLHHFGSKEALLIAVLEYRDRADLDPFAGKLPPAGMDLLRHLMGTIAANCARPGLVKTYVAITGESVTEDHPARSYVTERFAALRETIVASLREVAGPGISDEELNQASTSLIGVMDGVQLQWLLDPEAVDLLESTRFAVEAVVASVMLGAARPTPLSKP